METKVETTKEIGAELTKELSGIESFIQDKWPDVIAFGIKVLIALIVFFVGRIVIKWICNIVRKSLNRSHVDQGVEQFVYSLVKALLYIFLLVMIITNLGVETTSIAALVASGGVAIGLALQGSLSNFAGGVLILILKPFVVGDYIIEDSHGNEGTVKEIQLFYTKLSTIDNKTVIVPNGTLANSSMTNVTARAERQLDILITISYQSDLQKAKQVIAEVLHNSEAVLQEEEQQVFVSNLAAHGVEIGLRGWVKTDEFTPAKHQILEDIKMALDANDISMQVLNNYQNEIKG